ncbi:hypothetical protein C8C83_5268 [Flavobacterium sp. 90]|uniref:hypothetical protein n=1 Tax=unclassified Flavobacterium TaxID=196869 RepID=UPI000EB5B121|nr:MULTISPECIES: hypothetical protein [unclassified Flavobacterium]RKR05916.1 hypothetical protein C8C82_5616 [Flavobacterium sp. 81]TCK57226.1 hypothetical protein C8C83_5268 [Flavobacterium sp. 90]
MTNEIILLILGVVLGFGSSIGTLKYQEYSQRRKALNLLKVEIFKIDKLITPFLIEKNKIILPDGEIREFNGISINEIPNFKMITQLDLLLNLKDYLRESIYSISIDLEFAEKHRILAIPLLNEENRANELDVYGTIYLEYLKSAKEKIDELKNWLK